MEAELTPLAADVRRLAARLRSRGVAASVDRAVLMLQALAQFAAPTIREIYWCGRTTLCDRRDDFPAYDECFFGIFRDADQVADGRPDTRDRIPGGVAEAAASRQGETGGSTSPEEARSVDVFARESGEESSNDPAAERIGVAWANTADILRERDVATLSPLEQQELFRLIERFAARPPDRLSRRQRAGLRGAVDVRRTIRSALAHAGDPPEVFHMTSSVRLRRQIILIDISGSMARYAEVLLHLAHALCRSRRGAVEVFTLGTHLTRISRPLRQSRTMALSSVSRIIPDWQGGTRLGEQLQAFLDGWGQRGMARGADVLIASDGLERGDCSLLADQMLRLRRLAYRIVWCNPHKSTEHYQPSARGMQAALPHLDEFVSGRTLAEIEKLNALITVPED